MSWNYRVIRHVHEDEEYYAIHEVYYDDDGNPRMCSVEGVPPGGSDIDELCSDIYMMIEALERDTLDYTDFDPDNAQDV